MNAAAVTQVVNSKAFTYVVVGAVAVGAIYWIGKRFGDAAGKALAAVGTAVNPLSDQNLAYRGVNATGEAITGDPNFTLGGWLFDVFHKPYDPNAPPTGERLVGTTSILPVPIERRQTVTR
jgi:hypothetical protein